MEILWDIRSQLWLLVKSLLQIVDWLGQAFDFLIGANDISGESGVGDLLVRIFQGGEGTVNVTQIYFYILFACVLFMGVCVVIGAIKARERRVLAKAE